jgi:hypothetical protein
MTSTAKIAQGSTLEIAGTDGAAISITAISKAVGAVVTATNTLKAGDVVVFGTVTGMPEIAGRIGIVTGTPTGSSFTVNIDSSGFAAAGTTGTATPKTWVNIANLKEFNGFEGTVSEVDTTNLASLAKEFVPGLEDFGGVTGTVDLDPTDAGQIACMKAKSAQLVTYFRLTYPSASVRRAFQGFMKKFGEQGQVDGTLKSSWEVRATGRVVRTEVIN